MLFSLYMSVVPRIYILFCLYMYAYPITSECARYVCVCTFKRNISCLYYESTSTNVRIQHTHAHARRRVRTIHTYSSKWAISMNLLCVAILYFFLFLSFSTYSLFHCKRYIVPSRIFFFWFTS